MASLSTRRLLQTLARHTRTRATHQRANQGAFGAFPRNLASRSANEATGREAGADADGDEGEKPGAIGGFMRGLIGGQQVAVEDAFIAEAKEQGVKLPPVRPVGELVAVRQRRREERAEGGAQTIRERIFGRFGGSAFMQGAFEARERMAERFDESENVVARFLRGFYDRVFAENEMGMVVREIREEEGEFRVSEFLGMVEGVLVPGILGAYLEGDGERLKGMCTEEAYAMLKASIREREAEGVVMDRNILDVSDVELTAGKLLEDSPVLIVSFSTQQINCIRNRGGEVVEGREDDIRAVYYAWALVREAEFEDVMPTGGGINDGKEEEEKKKSEGEKRSWKLMEMVIRGAHSTI